MPLTKEQIDKYAPLGITPEYLDDIPLDNMLDTVVFDSVVLLTFLRDMALGNFQNRTGKYDAWMRQNDARMYVATDEGLDALVFMRRTADVRAQLDATAELRGQLDEASKLYQAATKTLLERADIELAKKQFAALDGDQRLAIMSSYCRGCGVKNPDGQPRCQCANES